MFGTAILIGFMVTVADSVSAQQSTDSSGCSPITLPLHEDFDGVADTMLNTSYLFDCWTRVNSLDPTTSAFMATFPHIVTSNFESGNDLFWYAGNVADEFQCVALPQVDTSLTPVNSLQLVMRLQGGFGVPHFQVGVMSDPTDSSTFEMVEEFSYSDYWNSMTYEVSLAAYSGSGTYVAIRFVTDSVSWRGAYMQEITLMQIPPCRHVYDLTASVGTDDADLQWATTSPFAIGDWDDGDSLWLVRWGDTSATMTTTSFSIGGLEADSLYTFSVASLCADTSEFRSIAVNTLTVAPVTELHYHCDFEDDTEAAKWLLVNGNEPAMWVVGSAINNSPQGSQSLYVSGDGGTHNNGAGSSSHTFAMRTIHFDTGDYLVCFDWRIPQSGVLRYMRATLSLSSYSLTPGTNLQGYGFYDNNLIGLDSNKILGGDYYWHRQKQQVHISRPGNYNLAFHWHQGYNPNYSVAIDNVSVYRVLCPQPSEVAVTMGANSATLNWEGDSAAQWRATCALKSPQSGAHAVHAGVLASQTVMTTATTASFTGLEMGTDYTLSVRNMCDTTPMQPHQHYDDQAYTISATTLCDSIRRLPYYNDFDDMFYDIYDRTCPLVNCWNRFCTYDTADLYNYQLYPRLDDYGLNGSLCLRWLWSSLSEKQTIVLPPVAEDVSTMDSLRLYFKAKRNNYIGNPRFVLGVMSDPYDYSTFVAVDSTFIRHDYFEDYELSLAAYSGTGRYVALHLSEVGQPTDYMNSKSVFVDNMILGGNNLCHQPVNIVTHAFHNRVELSWSPAGDESMWEVRYGDVDTLVVTPEITIDGLQPLTSYPVEIISVCGSENYGIPFTMNVTTSCPPAEVPYSCGFEEGIPSCWWKSGNDDPYLAGGSGLYAPHSGTRFVMMSGNPSGSSYLALPIFIAPTDSLELSLWIDKDSLVVGVMADPYNLATFTPLRTVSVAQPYTYEQMHCYFPAYSGAERYLALRGPATSGGYSFFGVDDIEVDYAPSCKTPDSWRLLACGSIDATMQWYGQGGTLFRIDCMPVGGGQTVTAYSQTEMATVTGLEPGTTYNVSVRAVCGVGDTSAATTGMLTTGNACAPVADVVCSDTTLHSVTIDWTERGLSTAWSIEYGPVGFTPGTGATYGTNSHPYLLSGLAAATSYDIYVTPLCSDGSTVPAANPVTVTTLDYPPCLPPDTLGVDSVGYNWASLSWAAPLDGDSLLFRLTVSSADDSIPLIVMYTDNNSVTVTGLSPTTSYTCGIEHVCDTLLGRASEPVQVVFSTDTLLCFVPESLTYSDVDYTSVTLDWQSAAESDIAEIRIWNTVFDTVITTSQHPLNVTSLEYDVAYNATVRSVCGEGLLLSEWSDTVTFRTLVCDAPSGVRVTDIDETSAVVRWEGDAESYDVEYGEHNFSQGMGTLVSGVIGNSLSIAALEPGEEYDVAVRSRCGAQIISLWTVVTFNTAEEVGIPSVDGEGTMAIYPNPAGDKVTVALGNLEGEIVLTLVGIDGKILRETALSCHGGGCTADLDISQLASGVYYLHAVGGGADRVLRLVKKMK